VTEELAFQEGFCKGAAIDRDERPFLSETLIMDRFGNQFFPCAGGSCDQDRCLGLGYLADQVITFNMGLLFPTMFLYP